MMLELGVHGSIRTSIMMHPRLLCFLLPLCLSGCDVMFQAMMDHAFGSDVENRTKHYERHRMDSKSAKQLATEDIMYEDMTNSVRSSGNWSTPEDRYQWANPDYPQ